MNQQDKDIVTIDRDIYDHLGPLHQMAVDILVGKGKWIIKEPKDISWEMKREE